MNEPVQPQDNLDIAIDNLVWVAQTQNVGQEENGGLSPGFSQSVKFFSCRLVIFLLPALRKLVTGS